jgi:hypothetical protein
VIFYTDGSICEGRAGAGVFSDTLDIRESYALGYEELDRLARMG